jgi:hypothetical protein
MYQPAQLAFAAAVADVANSSWSFIQEISKEKNPLPRVLVTHIPLYRPDDTPCGANRASPVINQRVRSMQSQPFQIL